MRLVGWVFHGGDQMLIEDKKDRKKGKTTQAA
jgi:hypothetical protein